jgi:hypothetical protein
LVSQPLSTALSQLPKPASQVRAHAPAAQTDVALVRAGQTLPHAPQLELSFVVERHTPPQADCPAGHALVQVPLAQTCPAAHRAPQRPQFVRSRARSASQPLARSASQSARPCAHDTSHKPLRHRATCVIGSGTVQRRPHTPQWFTSRVSAASQPVASRPSQSPKPRRQLPAQVPDTQVATALAGVGQARLHTPQWATSLARVTSQPSARLLLQSATPLRQAVVEHAPATHPCPVGQTVPQAPHWLALVRVSVSQPLRASPSQSAKPALQVRPHWPSVQVGVVLGRAGQARPQAPQCATLVRGSASQPLAARLSQSRKPPLHARVHCASAHAAVWFIAGMHASPQRPQLVADDRRSVSQPLAALLSQLARPSSHAVVLHTPATQGRPAGQARPHIPQCAALVVVFTSQPFAGIWSQSAKPGWQGTSQTPATHATPGGQRTPHPPQLAGSVAGVTSQPFSTRSSQSRVPCTQSMV